MNNSYNIQSSRNLALYFYDKCKGLYFRFFDGNVFTDPTGTSSFKLESPIYEGNKRIGKVVYEIKVEATTYLEE